MIAFISLLSLIYFLSLINPGKGHLVYKWTHKNSTYDDDDDGYGEYDDDDDEYDEENWGD